MDKIAKHIIFVGRVQGVGFRFTAHSIANSHQLTGMVRNLHDGTVEMFVQGYPEDVSNCLDDIKDVFQFGIRETKIQELPYDAKCTEFRITF